MGHKVSNWIVTSYHQTHPKAEFKRMPAFWDSTDYEVLKADMIKQFGVMPPLEKVDLEL